MVCLERMWESCLRCVMSRNCAELFPHLCVYFGYGSHLLEGDTCNPSQTPYSPRFCSSRLVLLIPSLHQPPCRQPLLARSSSSRPRPPKSLRQLPSPVHRDQLSRNPRPDLHLDSKRARPFR